MKIKDEKGRTVIAVNKKGKIAIARFPDLSDEFKDYLVKTAVVVTDIDPQKLRDFLDFKTDQNEFCS